MMALRGQRPRNFLAQSVYQGFPSLLGLVARVCKWGKREKLFRVFSRYWNLRIARFCMGAGERLSLGKGVEDRWPEREYDGCRNRSTERGWGPFSSKVFPPMRKSRLHPSIRVCNHAAHARYIESGKIEKERS